MFYSHRLGRGVRQSNQVEMSWDLYLLWYLFMINKHIINTLPCKSQILMWIPTTKNYYPRQLGHMKILTIENMSINLSALIVFYKCVVWCIIVDSKNNLHSSKYPSLSLWIQSLASSTSSILNKSPSYIINNQQFLYLFLWIVVIHQNWFIEIPEKFVNLNISTIPAEEYIL